MAFCNQESPAIPTKKYKRYKTDPDVQIPLRTINRWHARKKNIEENEQHDASDNRRMDVSDSDTSSESEKNDDCNLQDDTEYDSNESENDVDDVSLDNESEEDNQLYENSKISVDQSVYNLLHLYTKHKLSKSALKDALGVLLETLPANNNMPKTILKLLQYVRDIAPACEVIKHFYCKKCFHYMGTDDKITRCDACNESQNNLNFFSEFDIETQIKYLFENNSLAEKLKPFSAEHTDANIISDITDGSEYIRVHNARENRNEYDLTLILNTDGLSLVKSSKSNCWPLMYTIAELPQYLRNPFIIILGLWYDSDCKPLMNTFLQPFCSKLQKVFRDGIVWEHPKTGQTLTSTVVAPLFIADAPARASLQNILNFNGNYGCNICELQSEKSVNIERRKKRSRIYPFSDKFKLRNGLEMEKQAQQVSESTSKSTIKGVKGYSVLSTLPLLDLGTCLVPEYMHSVLLGVARQFFNLWFNVPGSWSIKKDFEAIDNTLLAIKPPQSLNRLPRSLNQLQFYKASEYYNLILFYSLPVLVNHLPKKFFQHWILFVIAINTLLQDKIKIMPDLEKADELLKVFVQKIPELYNDTVMTYNVHQMLHLVLCVKRWGPLHVTSAFPFENQNGYIADIVHGNKHIGQEIINNLNINQGVQILKYRIEKNASCNKHLSKNWELLGKKVAIEIRDDERQLLESNGLNYEKLDMHVRAKINNEVFTSVRCKITKTDSSVVEMTNNNESVPIYGSNRIFFSYENTLYFIIQRFNIKYVDMFCHVEKAAIVTHIIPVEESDDILLVKYHQGMTINQLIRIGNYICKKPNKCNQIW